MADLWMVHREEYHNSVVVNNYINIPETDKGITDVFSLLSQTNRAALSMTSGDTSVHINKEEYPLMSTQIVTPLDQQEITEEDHTTMEELLIKKPDLLGNSRWEFLFNGKSISADIEDNAFRKKILSGRVSISSGAKIRVKLRTSITKDAKGKEKTEYAVIQVLGDIIPLLNN